jgi:hypothetical protein
MCDALERFAITISPSRIILHPESCFDIVNRILTPPAPPDTKLVESASASAAAQTADQAQEPLVPALAMAGSEPAPFSMAEPAGQGSNETGEVTPQPATAPTDTTPPVEEAERIRRPSLTRNQWILLIIMVAIWVIILLVLGYLIARDFLL